MGYIVFFLNIIFCFCSFVIKKILFFLYKKNTFRSFAEKHIDKKILETKIKIKKIKIIVKKLNNLSNKNEIYNFIYDNFDLTLYSEKNKKHLNSVLANIFEFFFGVTLPAYRVNKRTQIHQIDISSIHAMNKVLEGLRMNSRIMKKQKFEEYIRFVNDITICVNIFENYIKSKITFFKKEKLKTKLILSKNKNQYIFIALSFYDFSLKIKNYIVEFLKKNLFTKILSFATIFIQNYFLN